MKQDKKECLEAIMLLTREGNTVWPASLVSYLGFSLKDVKEMLESLEKKEYVTEKNHGVLVLTDKGMEKAERFHKKKKLLNGEHIGKVS